MPPGERILHRNVCHLRAGVGEDTADRDLGGLEQNEALVGSSPFLIDSLGRRVLDDRSHPGRELAREQIHP